MTNTPQALRAVAASLIQAAEMLEHNEAIFKGPWKKGAKAWSGDFIERTVKDGLALIGAGHDQVLAVGNRCVGAWIEYAGNRSRWECRCGATHPDNCITETAKA